MLNVAVIGAGSWGKNLVRNFASAKGAALAVVCDREESRLAALRASYPQTKFTRDSAGVFGDPSIGAVVIATDAPTHFELAKAALEAGKHCYVEKPMCQSAAEADKLAALAERLSLKLMVGHLLLYHPAVAKLKSLIDSGELGDIYYMYTQRLNLGVVRSNENAWWSLAPHDVSVINHLFSAAPARVSAQGQCYLQKGIEDVVFATLYFADGRLAQVHTSWLDPHKMRRMTIVGSQKMVTFDDMEPSEKVWIYDKGATANLSYSSYGELITLRQGDIYIPKLDTTEPLKLECQHFVDCVVNGTPVRTGGRDGAAVVKVLEAGQRSIKAGGRPEEV
jgi:predicted dehydrogenase